MNVGNFSNKTDTTPVRFFIHGDLMQKTGFIYQEIRILYFMFHVKSTEALLRNNCWMRLVDMQY